MQIDANIINELHLGSRLNDAIAAKRRGEFALLLSLLSADVRDMAQFSPQDLSVDETLRREFDVPGRQPLTVNMALETCWDHSQAFFSDSAAGFYLRQSLLAEPLVYGGAVDAELMTVLENCSHSVKHRCLHHSDTHQQMPEPPHLCDQLQAQRLMINSLI
ncbi:VC2046/SO_2500 family protein [Shewanella sp. NIFS-20-20]|uniref:VC2046/SO_2500 family protein n=1 Tax=Shewanella sp. NIFS-20-20 TaxID=2853806 RepID=UPI001C4977A5|nr:VC2046/SO_2500 family protein [Shewanella sp. NIFS-20-20]MBV7317584.1 queD-like protein [Shewanella sp. NIFS-20-20]